MDAGLTVRPNILARNRPVEIGALRRRAERLRLEVLDLIEIPRLGHYSSTMSCVELLTVLYLHTLRLAPSDPHWADRDRFLLGKGHVAVGLWPLLAELGYFPAEWLARFGKLGSPLTDHPDMRRAPGADFSAGSLGHNLSVGVGMSLAARVRRQDYRCFVLLGDGEIHEGQVWEAAMAASHYGLGNLVAIIDANGSSGDGPTSKVMNIEPLAGRFQAFGWRAVEIDGHDVDAIVGALDALPKPESQMPTCVIARTLKGKGVSFMEAAPRDWHLGHVPEDLLALARREIAERLS
ncbi:MAG: transketolase [Hyphomicrobiales bacterium]